MRIDIDNRIMDGSLKAIHTLIFNYIFISRPNINENIISLTMSNDVSGIKYMYYIEIRLLLIKSS